jgi:GntR family transcriptional repressor for pyruvate dehydrogenase complex
MTILPASGTGESFADVRMHERLAVALAQEIVSGRLAEGSTFPTSDALAETYSISRTVAREALQGLAAAGLLRIQHGKRTVVNPVAEWRFLDVLMQRAMQGVDLPEKLVRDLYEARRTIETETARLCAQRATQATIETLDTILTSWEALQPDDGTPTSSEVAVRGVPLDRAFHGTIGDGSGNVVLARAVRDAHHGLVTTWHLSSLDNDQRAHIAEQHRAIYKAIAGRNAAAAADAMRRHINWSMEDALSAQARGDEG